MNKFNSFGKRKFILFLIMFVLCSFFVNGLGILPASKEIFYTDNPVSFDLRILNNDNKNYAINLVVDGDLADYVALSTYDFLMGSSEKFKDIKVLIDVPVGFVGKKESRIIATGNVEGQGQVGAVLGVISRLNVLFPFDGYSLKMNVIAPKFEHRANSNFVLRTQNEGFKDGSAKYKFSVKNSNNFNVFVVEDYVFVKGLETEDFFVSWVANVPKGLYTAEVVVSDYFSSDISDIDTYGFDKEYVSSAKFYVGSPVIKINKVNIMEYSPGNLAALIVFFESDWPENLQVNFDVYLSNDTFTSKSFKSQDFVVGLKEIQVPIFLDLDGVEPGSYNMNFKFNRNDIKDISSVIVLGDKSFTSKPDFVPALLIVFFVILILGAIYIVFRLSKRDSK